MGGGGLANKYRNVCGGGIGYVRSYAVAGSLC